MPRSQGVLARGQSAISSLNGNLCTCKKLRICPARGGYGAQCSRQGQSWSEASLAPGPLADQGVLGATAFGRLRWGLQETYMHYDIFFKATHLRGDVKSVIILPLPMRLSRARLLFVKQ